MKSRLGYSTQAVVAEIWSSLGLPESALSSLVLPDADTALFPTSHKVSVVAQASIASSALAATLVANKSPVPRVTVPLRHVAAEVQSHALYSVTNGKRPPTSWGPLAGAYKTKDGGYVGVHDNFLNHRLAVLETLGLPADGTKEDVTKAIATWNKVDLETAATEKGRACVYALRSYDEWDALPQSSAVADLPVSIRQLSSGPARPGRASSSRCLQGLRVVELSRVIAGPVAGKTLAAHGADVIWVTSPNLPDLPELDMDLSRGKRTIQLDLNQTADKTTLLGMIKDADVFLQGYRPGSLAHRGFSVEELTKLNPSLIIGNMSAFGSNGPWASRRGFDSLVQVATGMRMAEAQRAGKPETSGAAPFQILDHAGGYLLATGIMAAVYHRDVLGKGGSWVVEASLAGVQKYLRSLGHDEADVFRLPAVYPTQDDVPREMLETRDTGYGEMTFVKHSASIDGVRVGWDEMPKPLGSDSPGWQS